MSAASTRTVMDEYLDALVARGDFARFFTDDVHFEVVGTEQQADGRDAVEAAIRGLHETAFDARPEVKLVVATDEHAMLEADFVGTHTGEFAGIAATGAEIRVPYAMAYDLRGERISALRGYLSLELLAGQVRSGG